MDATITVPARTRNRDGQVIAIAPYQARVVGGVRGKLVEHKAARAVKMAPDQLEALAAVAYAAESEYAARCCGEMVWPSWGRITAGSRARWRLKVERVLEGVRLPVTQLRALDQSDIRRYRLMNAVVAALTAVA